MKRIGVLISGRGSNLQALLDAAVAGRISGQVVVVISDKADAYGLERARQAGVEALFIDPKGFASKKAYNQALVNALQTRDVDLVCLAGYMRIVRQPLIDSFAGRMLNIHPSLLPSFPGLHAQRQALEHGVKFSGCTVHFVTEGMDEGPILLQAVVPVLDDDTEERLSERILAEEHRIYPEAVELVLTGKVTVQGRRVLRVQ